jgi:hypothetical protein
VSVNAYPRNRWHELCSRCNQPCHNTGSKWIDGSRICGLCKRLLEEDVKELQKLSAGLWHGRELSNEQLIEALKRVGADRIYVVRERKKSA